MDLYKGRLLLVDDDTSVLEFFAATFERAGHHVAVARNLEEMRDRIERQTFDGVFLDLNLSEESGLEGLPQVLKAAPFTHVFILTSQNEIEKATECMERGASWYFTKGTNPDNIVAKVEEFFSRSRSHHTVSSDDAWRSHMVGESDAIQETLETISKLRQADSTVLILGESGTGKELIARAIHSSSDRKAGRFEAINCGAIPENLLESELFGHKKGAFTDAKQDRMGIFEVCSSGTLLLDEIGDMPLPLQTKLLRVLQERKVTPVGSSMSKDINTRVIAATHRDVDDEVKSGRFRDDLYYRLSVVVIQVPALRHRKEDIPLLLQHFLETFNKRFKKEVLPPPPSLFAKLKAYEWPGNIRELQNAVERGVVLSPDNNLHVEDMFSHLSTSANQVSQNSTSEFEDHRVFEMPLTEAKQYFEKAYLERLLKNSKGNVAELARRSGRYRADLYRIMERYQIDLDSYRGQ